MSTLSDSKIYKIGTRASLLAKTQCQQTKELLQQKTGLKFELVEITTQGDMDTSAPLWQLEGKDFFTKELDQALLAGEVDLVVHSYKDLGSERPEGIALAAITKREFANDILLIRQDVLDEMSRGHFHGPFVVGTSSPRRMDHCQERLHRILPVKDQKALKVEVKTLRGNVNTRIDKLKRGDYHAIILAMAGLERLAQDPHASSILKDLIGGLNFAILSQKLFPSAASQGALAIECRQDDHALKEILLGMNDSETIDEVERERQHFQSFGGGCHLAVGINVRKHANYFIHSMRGSSDNQKIKVLKTEGVQERASEVLKELEGDKVFYGMPAPKSESSPQHIVYDQLIRKKMISGDHELINSKRKIFVATAYASERLPKDLTQSRKLSLWAAGSMTWQRLAQQGHWFHGCSEGLGHQEIHRLSTESHFIKLFLDTLFNIDHDQYTVLTHKDGDSRLGPVVAAYDRTVCEIPADYQQHLQDCRAFYWTSRRQAETFLATFPFIKEKAHFCGLGKTYKALKEMQLAPLPVSSPTEFRTIVEPFLK